MKGKASALLWIVAPVHQRIAPVAGGRIALARALRQVAVYIADDLMHVPQVVLAQIRCRFMQQLDDAPAGLVSHRFAAAMLLANPLRILGVQPS